MTLHKGGGGGGKKDGFSWHGRTRLYAYMGKQGYDKGITRKLCIYGDESGIIADDTWYSHMKCIPALVSTCKKNLPSCPQNDETFYRKVNFDSPLLEFY